MLLPNKDESQFTQPSHSCVTEIPHQFGGGAPVPVVLHLTKKLPVFDSESIPVSLIDETEQGYYVLSANDKALFVARSLVEGVEFLRHGQAAQIVPAKP